MKDIGLNDGEISLLFSVFRQYPELERVVVFGSRAKGNFQPNSDIDLAVEGIDNALKIETLVLDLDDLPLPYKIDIKSLNTITHKGLLAHIQQVGTPIYP